MAKPSLRNIRAQKTQLPNNELRWEVEFDAITSAGTVSREHKGYSGLTKAQVFAAIRQVAIDLDNAEKAAPAAPVIEFDGWFDATKNTPTAIDDSDKPALLRSQAAVELKNGEGR